MKNHRTHPKYSIINIQGLALIYLLLTVLTILFFQNYISSLLEIGDIPEPRSLIAFFIIPAVLLVFLTVSIMDMVRDFVGRLPLGRFQARLMFYFVITIVLAATPVVIITNLAVGELLKFWRTIDVESAVDAAQGFAMDTYSLYMKELETRVKQGEFDFADGLEKTALPEEVLGIQDFTLRTGGIWVESNFAGNESLKLGTPPLLRQGFAPRELPRDADVIRYILTSNTDRIRVITWDLGEGFNSRLETIENERARFRIIDSIRYNIQRLLVFYYGVFFLPAILMTLIIALSFARRITSPIRDLTEATRKVAEGDFSIQVLPRKGDELALLVRSFNAMVKELENSRTALVKAEKISIWQTMAQQLAHEIKNPLTPIRLSAERVLRRWRNEPEKIGEILESSMLSIIQETEGLSTLLTEFRTLSKPMEPSQSWTEVRGLVEEAIEPYGVSHPGVGFDIDNVEKGISIKIDRHRLGQILTNLIINAIDAMDDAGLIEIRTDLVKKRASRYCRISIRDSGKGISEEDAKSIFTPYFTTKESGTGLGLPIVERIVNEHGGAIWFDSAKEAGTTFYIDLPIEVRET
jgi:nitrogen fixation/metabolism regulation signal transduction histidine kinase